MLNFLIRWGILPEPSLERSTAGIAKVFKKLEKTVNFHRAKQSAAIALSKAKAREAEIAEKVHQDTAVVLQNFKQLLNVK